MPSIDTQLVVLAAAIAIPVFAIVASVVTWLVFKIKRRVDSIGDHRPVKPTPQLVRYWQQQMDKYPKGSAKWKAYRKRLLEWGDGE